LLTYNQDVENADGKEAAMLKEGCPGSREIRSPYPEEIKCVFCGAPCEIWSDETQMRCKSCGETFDRNMKPSCIMWCPAAKECVGKEKYDRIAKAISE